MESFQQHSGVAAPLRRSTVDTDQIIPAAYLKRVTKTGFADGLFAAWRGDPAFVLNDPRYPNPSILVAGSDFGIGSSREHAVWALRDFGFRVVISSRFGDIFRGNAGKQGLLTARVDEQAITELWELLEAEPGTSITVDLQEQQIHAGQTVRDFDIDAYTRYRLLEGLDDIALTLQDSSLIEEFESGRAGWSPSTVKVVR